MSGWTSWWWNYSWGCAEMAATWETAVQEANSQEPDPGSRRRFMGQPEFSLDNGENPRLDYSRKGWYFLLSQIKNPMGLVSG